MKQAFFIEDVYKRQGYFDLKAYENFNNGTMVDYIPTDEELAASFAKLPPVVEE